MSSHHQNNNGVTDHAKSIDADPAQSIGLPSSRSPLAPHSSSAACFGSRNPIAPFLLSRGVLKISLPFVIAVLSLTAYSTLDRLLPPDAPYGSLEYALSESALQSYIDRFDRAQFAVVGFSVGLHLLNAIMYAATLALAGSLSSLQLRAAGHARLGALADATVCAQFATVILYFIQHITLLSMFLRREAGPGQPQLVAACSILFLVVVGCCVLFNIAVALWILIMFRRAHGGKSPLALRLEAEAREDGQATSAKAGGSPRSHPSSNGALVAPSAVAAASSSSVQMNQIEVNAAKSSATMDEAV